MKIIKNKFFMIVMISLMSVNLLFCGKKEKVTNKVETVQKVEEKQTGKSETAETEAKESSEEEITYGIWIDEEFKTDWKLQEEKLLNNKLGYQNTA